MAAGALDGPVPADAPSGQQIRDRLNQLMEDQRPRARENIARARQRNPEVTPAQIIRDLERRYVRDFPGRGGCQQAGHPHE